MDLVLELLTALGIGLACGIRPLLPVALVGTLALADLGIDYDGTDVAFAESIPWIVVLALLGVALLVFDAKLRAEAVLGVLAFLAVLLAAIHGAGATQDKGEPLGFGAVAAIVGAVVAILALRGLLERVRARLDSDAQSTLPLFAEGAALLVALLSVLLPPVSLLALVALVVLAVRGRRREGEKHAGLRVLR